MSATPPVRAQERRNGSPSLLVSWGVGFLTGALCLFLVTFDRLDAGNASPQAIAAPNAQGTTEVHVDVTLHEATATVTAIPTARPTDAPTVAPGLNWCSTPVAGKVCEVPPLPTATATAYPDCADMAAIEPGDLCQWR